MTNDHARKESIREIMKATGTKRRQAAALLDQQDRDEREGTIVAIMNENDCTREGAIAILDDPRNEIMCEKCGWTYGMVCPECPGCGCYNGQCSGWRHHEYADDEYDDQDGRCPDCGGELGVDPRYGCDCGDA